MTNTNRIRAVESPASNALEQTLVTTPSGQTVLVSTVSLAFNPMIADMYDQLGGQFETMVFPTDEAGSVTDWMELYCDRYKTAAAAMEGHANIVEIFYNKPMHQLSSSTEEND
jgi:hypothetical protein